MGSVVQNLFRPHLKISKSAQQIAEVVVSTEGDCCGLCWDETADPVVPLRNQRNSTGRRRISATSYLYGNRTYSADRN